MTIRPQREETELQRKIDDESVSLPRARANSVHTLLLLILRPDDAIYFRTCACLGYRLQRKRFERKSQLDERRDGRRDGMIVLTGQGDDRHG